MQSFEQIEMAVIRWAEARRILPRSTSQAQVVKLVEEIGEVAHAVARNDKAKLKDGIGDALVVLTMLADLNGLSLRECYAAAYQEIRDRRGVLTHEGIFVKEE